MIWRIIATALFGGFGIVLFVVGVKYYIQQRRFLADPQRIEVIITTSEVKQYTDTRRKSNGFTSTTHSYRPILKFTYDIDGRPYESDLIQPSDIRTDYGSRSSAEEVIAPYPVGAKVRAYYQPAYPDKAFLHAERSAGPIVFIVLGIILGPLVWFVGKWIF